MKSKEEVDFYDMQNVDTIDAKDSYDDDLGLLARMARKRKRLEEGDSWQGDGHYTADGEEWSGWQHAHDGQIMTGKEHDDSSVNLYHFKELDPEVQKKVLAKIQSADIDESVALTVAEYMPQIMTVLNAATPSLTDIQKQGIKDKLISWVKKVQTPSKTQVNQKVADEVKAINEAYKLEAINEKWYNTALDVAGIGADFLVPGAGAAFDLPNAVLLAKEKKYLFAALSLISVVPVIGDLLGKGGKILVKSLGFAKTGNAARKAAIVLKRGKTGKLAIKLAKALKNPATQKQINAVFAKAKENEKLKPHVDKMEGEWNEFAAAVNQVAALGEAYELGTDEYRKYAEKLTPGQGLKETKTIKVGEDSVGAKSTTYALVKERKILALGEKKSMIQASRKQGGRVWLVSGDQTVGNLVEALVIEDEYSDEAEEMLQRIKDRAADRKASETEERPQSETKVRPATRKILEKRAIRLARALTFKKLSGGKAKSELLFPERLKIERQIAANKKAINKLAASLYPIIDQKEQERKLPPI